MRMINVKTRDELLKKANVNAVGIGFKTVGGKTTRSISIVCSVVKKLPLSQLGSKDRIPEEVEGTVTDVVERGVIHELSNTGRMRPAKGGCSIGHKYITAGTLGCLVKKNDLIYILSNNHVLANSNDAVIGDEILQPGAFDGGRLSTDIIGNLSEFVPIYFSEGGSSCPFARLAARLMNIPAFLIGSKSRMRSVSTRAVENLVDAAIARPLNEADVKNEILDIGAIAGVDRGILNMGVKKSGRTTGLTTGVIEQIEVSVMIQYRAGKIALFTDQLMAGSMCEGGDSGSAVVSTTNKLVGLLFAGSDNSTIINKAEHVFSLLGVELA